MKKELEKVYEITVELQQLLEKPVSATNREAAIQQLNELIEQRGILMEQITPPYSREEMKLGEKIYQINLGIQEKMERLFSDLKIEMQQMKKQKKTQQSYTNPYKQVSVSEGSFLDRKK